ncbi:MAG: DUF2625 family protein [Anaerolineae bacterium]|nr:DUF2625 family protein [Anaerolineae bacterium]
MKLKSLASLTKVKDPAWPEIKSWLEKAKNQFTVLEPLEGQGLATLYALQVTTHSSLGAIALNTGGVVIDKGWLRLLGAGSVSMKGSLCNWNGLSDDNLIAITLEDALIIGHDVLGGFFALNGGTFDGPKGNVFYLVPDSLEWEDCEKPYTDFLNWVFNGDLALFYQDSRWSGWEHEMNNLSCDQGFYFAPPLWSNVKHGIRQKKIASMSEIWESYFTEEMKQS